MQAFVCRATHIKLVDLIKHRVTEKGLNLKKETSFVQGAHSFYRTIFQILRYFPTEYCSMGHRLRTDMILAAPLMSITLKTLHYDTPQGTSCALFVFL